MQQAARNAQLRLRVALTTFIYGLANGGARTVVSTVTATANALAGACRKKAALPIASTLGLFLATRMH
jgi:hypothetical protein